MDRLTRERRSALMSRIGSKKTVPERVLRGALHRAGYRSRIHVKSLPGCPDLVFPKQKKAIFVHGCFWHSHPGCRFGRLPKSNLKFWRPKLEGNRERDERNIRKLRRMGWKVLIVWQCKLKAAEKCVAGVVRFLER